MDLSSPVTRRMPSPTLTNPDMILPEDSHPNPSTSPHQSDGSPLPQWQQASTADDGQMKAAVRNLFGNGHRLRHRNSEKTLKTQEPLDRRPQSKQSDLTQRSTNSALASSPLLHEEFGVKTMGGSIPKDGVNDDWDAHDDGSIISESISPLVEADKENYMMSENGGLSGYKFSDRFRKAIVEEDDESYSHAAMSVRAEEILANAKRRLTEMENNLSRARHTVSRPSSSMSSFYTNGTESQSLYTLPMTLSPSKHRQQNSPPSTSSSKGHSRVFSETSVPSSMQTSPRNGDGSVDVARHTNGISNTTMDAPANTATKQGSESRDWFWAGLTRNPTHSAARHTNYGLQPLNEDGPPPSTFDSPERYQTPPVEEQDLEGISATQQDPNDSNPEQAGPSSNGLTRAKSTNQMRDIRDQMQDLKGKISNLKQRAREDSLRRRSLQSLRTPSPFTAAEQWYAGASGNNRDRSRSRPREGSPPSTQPRTEEEDETLQYPVQAPDSQAQGQPSTAVEEASRDLEGYQHSENHGEDPIARGSDDSPRTVIDRPLSGGEELATDTTLDEPSVLSDESSIEGEPPESDPSMLELAALPRHEDRPDAFDYEHLFLHSGMGTLGQGRRSRSSSHSSSYSVETTKPSRASTGTTDITRDRITSFDEHEEGSSPAQHSAHARKGSVDSVSTVATFATATEGDRNGESDTDEEEWVNKRPMAGSWEPDYPRPQRHDGHQLSSKAVGHTAQTRSPPQAKRHSPNAAASPMEPSMSRPYETSLPDFLAFLSGKLPSTTGSTASQTIELSDSDKELAEKLVCSVAKVCAQLQAFSMEGNKSGVADLDADLKQILSRSTFTLMVFDVGLDVDRIKNGLKIPSSNKRNRNQRSNSISGSPPKQFPNGNQLAVVPKVKEKKSNPTIRSERQEDIQPLSPDPLVLPSVSSPTTHDIPQPPVHSPTMDGTQSSTEDHMEPIHTPTDDSNNFDLKPPPPNKPVKFLEHYSGQLFSDGHLRFILRDPTCFLRFTAFLNRYKPHAAPMLIRYLEAQKAVKAVEYANALAESFKPIPGDTSSQIPCAAATLDPRFESRSRRAMEILVDEALPAYITQAFTKFVTETMVREITGTTMPIMRELVGGLAEVFCLSDPSIKDNPIVYASEEFYRTTQYGRDYVIGRNCRFLQGPKTDRNTVARIKEAVRTGQESFETILNYRRDGSPFMNLVMTAPLYDNKGVVRYFIGAQVDISGLVEEGRGLDSFERYLTESRRNRNSDQSSYANQKHMKILSELSQMLSPDESSLFHGPGHSREGSVNESDHGSSRGARGAQQGRRDPNARRRRRVLGNEDEDEQEKERNAWAFTSLGPSGKLPGVYQNYLLLRPYPSLRIIFVSPALRIPGLLQAPFLSRIGGPQHVRSGLANAFENGEGITAKITWLPQSRPETEESFASRPGSQRNNTVSSNSGNSEGRTRYISCTPLFGSDDKVGVWMVVMVENET
ncbi:MAG: hypothetical protein Q9192_001807, partial [Flavoplaca navasiana]